MEEKNKRDTPDEQIQLSLPIPTGQVKAQQGETVAAVAAAAPDPVPDPKGTESASEELNEIQTCSDNEEQRGREAVIQDTVITPDSTAQGANAKTESSIDKGHDFEASLAELEKIVNQLEGEVKLEEALNLFDRGMSLSRQCQDSLQEAEQRIEILKRAINGTLNADKFNEDILQNSQ